MVSPKVAPLSTSGATDTLPRPVGLSWSRRVLFWMIVLLITVSPVIAGEAFLRLTDARLADDPYMNFGQVDSFFVTKEINGEPYYQVANREVYRERNTMFPLRKPPKAFRVFCIGGSASAG